MAQFGETFYDSNMRSGYELFPINKKDVTVNRNRKHIKEQVERLKQLSKTDEQIVEFLQEIDKNIGLNGCFDSVYELAEYVEIPLYKLKMFWLP